MQISCFVRGSCGAGNPVVEPCRRIPATMKEVPDLRKRSSGTFSLDEGFLDI